MYITRERNWEALLCVISPYKGQQTRNIQWRDSTQLSARNTFVTFPDRAASNGNVGAEQLV